MYALFVPVIGPVQLIYINSGIGVYLRSIFGAELVLNEGKHSTYVVSGADVKMEPNNRINFYAAIAESTNERYLFGDVVLFANTSKSHKSRLNANDFDDYMEQEAEHCSIHPSVIELFGVKPDFHIGYTVARTLTLLSEKSQAITYQPMTYYFNERNVPIPPDSPDDYPTMLSGEVILVADSFLFFWCPAVLDFGAVEIKE